MSYLGRIELELKTGAELFHEKDRQLNFDLLSFWRWAFSDVISNTTRGILAEYLVAKALGVTDKIREEWAPYDVEDPEGIRVEVKSAAYVQRWSQAKLTSPSFACPQTTAWDASTNTQSQERRRHSDVYVFALLAHQDQQSLDPLDVSQWQFYVLPTVTLDRRNPNQQSISLGSLQKLVGAVAYHELGGAIREAAAFHRSETKQASD